MPKGKEFSKDEKTLIFRVIEFVESERSGNEFPLNNATQRLVTVLGISESAVEKLRKELKDVKSEMQQTSEVKENDDEVNEALRSRLRTTSAPVVPKSGRKAKRQYSASVLLEQLPAPVSPKKKRHSGRHKIVLSELCEDTIRLEFHEMLEDKEYPTVEKLFRRLSEKYEKFPVKSATSLWRVMKRLGFAHKKTSEIKVPLDALSFVGAKYFRKLKQLRDEL
ncbi:unnamed protein product [Didymodactylos carnosus]|uniref:Uncharacterized protein n=1 Tax=Didymodactylos carnosus TaxID=1234261 RepID=A0A8S2YPV4_9BILA|nr:unnamed protein product [Didymodactylos carnosus]